MTCRTLFVFSLWSDNVQQNPTIDSFFQQLTEANHQWMQGWVNSLSPASSPTPPMTALHEALGQLSQNPNELFAHHGEYYRQHLDLWMGFIGAKEKTPVVVPDKNDRRFNAPEWEEPLFDYIRQNYLLT